MKRLPLLWMSAWALAASASPTQPPPATSDLGFATLDNGLRYRCVGVPQARGISVVLALQVGADHDPAAKTGLAQLLGEWLRMREIDRAPAERLQINVRGHSTLIAATGSRRDLPSILARLAEVLSGDLPMPPDDVHRAAARAALTADDEAKIFPGPSLHWVVARSLLAQTPRGRQGIGISTELRALRLEHEFVQRWYRDWFRPRQAKLAVFGPMEESDMVATVAGALENLPPGEPLDPAPQVHDSLGPPLSEWVHERVEAPFVTMALRAPEPEAAEYLPFAVAMQVVARKAARFFRQYRGGEASARFPIFSFAADEADLVARVNRRGINGQDPDTVRGEIERFVDSLYTHGVSENDVADAARAVSHRLQLPPYHASPGETAQVLLLRAQTLITAEIHGWPADLAAQIAEMPPERVQAVLRAALAPDQRCFFALLPRD